MNKKATNLHLYKNLQAFAELFYELIIKTL